MSKYPVWLLTLVLCTLILNVSGRSQEGNGHRMNKPHDTSRINQELEIPRIDYVGLSATQPFETDTSIIWFDDFDTKQRYMDSFGDTDPRMKFGESGASMIAGFKKGAVNGQGNRKVAFGDFPHDAYILKKNQKFTEIYWRIYVKHERGWEGAPAKMSRATSIVSQNWKQAMIAHVWSGADNSLTLDPARGVADQTDQIKTTGYNDFENLKWLGNKPSSAFRISATEESGYWVLVESMARLNTPGKSDGINRLWIDGRLEAERTNLNFRGSYTRHGINAVFLESYWNAGSPKEQGRWFDNFVVASQPIGPVVCPANPTLYRTAYHGPRLPESWEVELASHYDGKDVVFRSEKLTDERKVIIHEANGRFMGSLKEKSSLSSGKIYYCRVRQTFADGAISEWSRWHQGFRVE